MGITNNIPPSRLIQPGVIDNTAARPASPFEGQCIFQKDTDQLLVWNGTAWVIPNQTTTNPEGLELITTTTISGTATNLQNSISDTYDHYRLVLRCYGGTNGNNIWIQFLNGSTPYTSAVYLYGGISMQNNSSTVSGAYDYNMTDGCLIAVVSNSANDQTMGTVDIFGPKLATKTAVITNVVAANGGTSAKWFSRYSAVADNTSFDGFRIHTGTGGGTLTGSAQLYGYRKTI
jgi:hypothetical protein